MRRVSAEALEYFIVRRLMEMDKDKNLLNEIITDANSNSEKECKILKVRVQWL